MAIKCGSCKSYHETVDQVRVCYGLVPGEPLTVSEWSQVRFTQKMAERTAPEQNELFPTEGTFKQHAFDLYGRVDPPAANVVVKKNLPEEGTYTVVDPATEDYRTIEIKEGERNWTGRMVLSFLCGPDNGMDFRGFGHVDKTDGKLYVWSKFKTDSFLVKMAQALLALADGPEAKDSLAMAGELYALKSTRCCKCHRKLTVPASIHRGMGPDCAERWG